jgi:glucose-6-phosphate isomerase
MFDPGIGIGFDSGTFAITYEDDVFGPPNEIRTLDSIRASLVDQDAKGPEKLYAIAMDVGRLQDQKTLTDAMLLLGVVAYNAGTIGREPVRSQGHIHAISSHSGWSPPEVFEIWQGTAIIYMQERAEDDPGRCFAVTAGEGDLVVVPPGWAHMVVNGSINEPMVFGAICDRGYEGFEYEAVRAHRGLAYYPIVESGEIRWSRNLAYTAGQLTEKRPGNYRGLLPDGRSNSHTTLYQRAVSDPATLRFVPYPGEADDAWNDFVP